MQSSNVPMVFLLLLVYLSTVYYDYVDYVFALNKVCLILLYVLLFNFLRAMI